jgi:hypothetical protein
MTTVTISTNDYTVYDSVANISAFLAADPGRSAAWAALSADQKSQGAVAATRYLERQTWAGEAAVDGQDLAWPRTGVTDRYGNTVDDGEVPQPVLDAFYILANDLVAKPKDADKLNTSNNIRRVKAGSAEVERFRPEAGTVLLTQVMALVGQFLASQAGLSDLGAGYAGGTDQCSRLSDNFSYNKAL